MALICYNICVALRCGVPSVRTCGTFITPPLVIFSTFIVFSYNFYSTCSEDIVASCGGNV